MKLLLLLICILALSTSCSKKGKEGSGGIITTGGASGGSTTTGTTDGGTDGTTDGTTTGGTTGTPPEPDPVTIQSTFVDSPVTGLKYVSTTHTGHTDVNGKFPCNSGNGMSITAETVSFYFSDQDETTNNDIYLGQIVCRPVTSPLGIWGATTITTAISSLSSANQIRLKRILRIFQSLDADNNPENGIVFSPPEMAAVADYLDDTHTLGTAIGDIIHHTQIDATEFNTEITNIMNAVGRSGQSVTETNAVNHFNTWKAYCTTDSCNFPYTCLRGTLITDSTSPTFSVIDPSSGTNRGIYNEFPTDALIVLHYNYISEVYRLAAGGIYGDVDLWDQSFMQFFGTWTHSADPGIGLSINNIVYENATENILFSNATSISGVIEMDEFSYLAGSLNTDRQWTVSSSCTLPNNIEAYPADP